MYTKCWTIILLIITISISFPEKSSNLAMAEAPPSSSGVYIVYTEQPTEGSDHEAFHLRTLSSVLGRYPSFSFFFLSNFLLYLLNFVILSGFSIIVSGCFSFIKVCIFGDWFIFCAFYLLEICKFWVLDFRVWIFELRESERIICFFNY